MQKALLAILFVGLLGLTGCHAAQSAAVRADYYDPYPYRMTDIDPYYRFYADPFFYPAYLYDPFPRFFFTSEFLFIRPGSRIIILNDPRFVRPRGRRLHGAQRGSSLLDSSDRNLRSGTLR